MLPDFFADDIAIDATRLPLDSSELPSENFLMHLTGDGDSIAMCVFENRQHDVKVTLKGSGDQRLISGSEIGFEGKKIWVALMEAPKIWYTRDLASSDAGKVIPLDWTMPFPAAWRVDFTQPNELVDSWEMLLQEQKNGTYIKPAWLGAGAGAVSPDRFRWNPVLGSFHYPCWSDPDGRGYVEPPRKDVLQLRGPLVVYPINRVKQTPLDCYTALDVMRSTLGVGPCEHILDLAGHKSENRGLATCASRDTIVPIYQKHEQRLKRAQVDKVLDDALTFVKHIRDRITQYVELGQKLHAYLADQKKSHPELAQSIAELDRLTSEIDDRVAARADKIQTPDYVAQMNSDFRKNVLDDTGPEALKKCQAYAEALVVIGDNQDELAGECRWVVKALRQQAGLMLAKEPGLAPIAAEIRSRTQDALRNAAGHESPHH